MLSRSLLPVLALAGSAYQVSASGALDLSAACQTTMVGLIGSEFGTCADLIGLAGLFSSSGSVLAPLENWLGSVCDQSCSAAALANASAVIEAGCAADLAAGASVAVGLQVMSQSYDVFRDTLCLERVQNTTTKAAAPAYCMTDLLNAVQTATGGSLNSTTLLGFATGGVPALLSLFSQIPTSAICTDCVHAVFTEVMPLLGAQYAGLGATVLNSECKGINFSDGAIPTAIKEASVAVATGSTGSSAAKTSGAGIARGAWAAVGLVGVVVAGVAVLL